MSYGCYYISYYYLSYYYRLYQRFLYLNKSAYSVSVQFTQQSVLIFSYISYGYYYISCRYLSYYYRLYQRFLYLNKSAYLVSVYLVRIFSYALSYSYIYLSYLYLDITAFSPIAQPQLSPQYYIPSPQVYAKLLVLFPILVSSLSLYRSPLFPYLQLQYLKLFLNITYLLAALSYY